MVNPQQILEKKSRLFSIVLCGVVGILAVPIILPHIFHGFHIVHILVHVGGITLAVFLMILAIMAYNRTKTKRLLLTAIAFSVFFSSEIVTLLDATWPMLYNIGGVSLSEVGHLLMLTTLGLLAMGVFRND